VRARFLGAAEVAVGGGVYQPVRGRRNQQLLSLYGLHAGHQVADGRAFEAVWGEDLPPDPSGTLRTYVTRLRQVIGADALVRSSDGYTLAVDPADIDVFAFEHEVAAGRAALRTGEYGTAAHHLRQALGLWTGPPWAALAGWPPADAEVVRSRALRCTAEELAAECTMRQGAMAEAAEELAALCETEPWRERRWELLMVALALSGRQAEALRAFARARERLVDDLGIAPSDRLRQVELHVLRQEVEATWAESAVAAAPAPAVAPSPAWPPATEPPDPVRMFGRQAESSLLDDELAQALAGSLRVAVVSGEAGIGKTLLLQTLGRRAAVTGAATHRGECYEAEATGAYRPLVGLVRSVLGDLGSAGREALGREMAELAILLPELDDAPGGDEAHTVVGDRQLRLFDSVTRLLRAVTDDGPAVFVLDDAHWADRQTLACLAHVLRHLGPVRALVVLTYRPEEVDGEHPLRGLLGELRRRLALRELPLDPLPLGDLAELAAAVAEVALPPPVLEAVAAAAGGNPMFVTELARTLAPEVTRGAARTWSVDRLVGGLPAQIADVLSRRIALVGPRAREALAVVAACPGGCEVVTVAHVLDLDPGRVIDTVDELLAAGLLAEVPDGSGVAYAVAHALYGYAAFGSSSRARQVNVHFRLALVLDGAVDRDRDRYLAAAAYHWHTAGRSGDPPRAARRCEEAGDLAYERTAYADAVAHYGRALAAIGWAGHDQRIAARSAQVLAKRAEAADAAGDPDGRRRDAEAAGAAAIEAGDVVALGRAALAHGGFRSTYGAANPATTDLLSRAQDRLAGGDHLALQARVSARLAQERYHAGDYEGANRLSEQAIDLARRLDDDEVLAAACHGRVWTMNHPDWLDERLSLTGEMVARATRTRNREWEMAGRVWRAAALLEVGDMAALDVEMAVLAELAEVVAVPRQRVRVTTLEATVALMRGELDRGIELAQQAHAIGVGIEPENADQVLYAQMLAPLRERGELAGVLPLVEALAATYAEAPGWRCAAAFAFCAAGEPDRGWRLIQDLAADGFATVPRDLAWMQAMSYAAETVATVGDDDAAAALYLLVAPYDGRNVGLWDIASNGAVAHYLGLLAVCLGDRPAAAEYFDAAVAFNDRTGQVPAALRSRLARAQLRAATGDRDGATRDAADVLAVAEPHGYPVLATSARPLATPDG